MTVNTTLLVVAIAMLAAGSLQLAAGGVRPAGSDGMVDAKLKQVTGAFPLACRDGVAGDAEGAPSPDLFLGNDTRVEKKTHSNTPEQIHLVAASSTSMYFSWATGNASYTFCGDGLSPDSPPSLLAGMGCTYNQSRAQKVGSEVHISTSMNMSNHRTCATPPIGYLPETQYTQVYGVPAANNYYISPMLHTVEASSLKPDTKYYYRVGSSSAAFSDVGSFKTLPSPGTTPAKPTRIGVLADVGTTQESAHVVSELIGHKPDVVFLAGDHCYADNHQNDQRYWDAWFRLISNSTANTAWQVSLGNHEEETQTNDCMVNALANQPPNAAFYLAGKAPSSCGNVGQIKANCPNITDACPCALEADRGEKGNFPPEYVNEHCNDESAFVSATTRWPVPYQKTGSSSPHFYSFEFGLVHAIVLSPYQPYCGGSLPCFKYAPFQKVLPSGNSAQYEWLASDIKTIDRKKTPWVVAYFHNPWYTTFSGFKTDDCVRQALEPLLKQAEVDLVFNGHVHTYERSNPVYNFKATADNSVCNTVHVIVGDAGNDESLTCGVVDKALNKDGKLDCAGQQVAQNKSEGYYFTCHSPTFQDSPTSCLKDDPRVNTSVIPASYYGCQEDGYCPNKQTEWSAFRSAEYGSGLLEIVDSETATWSWNGFFKQGNETTFGHREGDKTIFKRCHTSASASGTDDTATAATQGAPSSNATNTAPTSAPKLQRPPPQSAQAPGHN